MSLSQEVSRLTSTQIEELIAQSADIDQPESGYQGSVCIVHVAGQPLVVKSTAGQGALSRLRRHMLGNEFRVYQKLAGVPGIPQCHGLVDGQYLLLQHIEGTAFREIEFTTDDDVHDKLLRLIENLHSNHVAHADLKRRDNLILRRDGEPYLVDFGTAIVRKPGFRPVNHLLFRIARQLDYHGWYKNKYRDRDAPRDPADAQYYKPMRTERAARWVRRVFRRPLEALRERLAPR
ncbi:MAG: hypothetical protein KJO54_04755 [Gammaproteobacteria bacterium]|nr:hypothetical protein [Gammaproteobacteria bacterium]NNF60664.1 hypothetical protein [Gammaproteobacteria bacterium]